MNKQAMQNEHEADLVTNLVSYILQQKQFNCSQVTVLSMYNGQVRLLRSKLNQKLLQDVRVSTVDNFQGEENEIIVLSLVRSNKENDIGFLKTENRINVGTSRAKIGFYIVGDAQMFKNQRECEFWQRIMGYIDGNDFLDEKIRSKCDRHNIKIILQQDIDFKQRSPNGGCNQLCLRTREICQHKCSQHCHQGSCNDQICNAPCMKFLSCMHKCRGKCSDPCEKTICREKIIKEMHPCQHRIYVDCYQDVKDVKCTDITTTKFNCKHPQQQVKCYQLSKAFCQQIIQVTNQNCGHVTNQLCGGKKYSRNQYECLFEVKSKCKDCGFNNTINCSDSKKPLKCKNELTIQLPCNHQLKIYCHEQKTAYDQPCTQQCNKLLDCGHPCQKKCGEKCSTCYQIISYKTSCCQFDISLPCHIVQQMNKGGKQLCFCNTNICRKHLKRNNRQDVVCNDRCGDVLPCMHLCKSKCKDCLYGLLHQPCTELVTKILSCGHKAILPCSSSVLFANCKQKIKLMSCKDKNGKTQTTILKCNQKIDAELFKECKDCQQEKVLTLACNHVISYPQVYFDYQFTRHTHLLPSCKEPRCYQQLTHHRFANQIINNNSNNYKIQQLIQSKFTLIQQQYESKASNIQIFSHYPVLANLSSILQDEQKPNKKIYKSDQKQADSIKELNKLRVDYLKIIINSFEKLVPYVEKAWVELNNDLNVQALCQAFRNIEMLYFQHLDNLRLSFYENLYNQIFRVASEISNLYYSYFKINLINSQPEQLPQFSELSTLQIYICSKLHLNINENSDQIINENSNNYCQYCSQLLYPYEIPLDI